MFKFTRTSVFCLFIIIIFFLIQIFIHQNFLKLKTEINEDIMQKSGEKQLPKTLIQTADKTEIWEIEIPKISLVANISETTEKEVLKQYVGHFEKTSKKQGNVGLALHNKEEGGYYFKNLKLLRKGDEIKYKYNEFEKIYEVKKCRIIKDTEWEYLDETEENMLTLITYIENFPEYRRCIQAEEKEEELY